MQGKSVTSYFRYSFATLFSKQFLNIAGSSLIVHTGAMMSIYMLAVFLLYRGAQMITEMDPLAIVRFFVQGYLVLMVMGIALLISRGWQATVMPIRSIDHTKWLHMRGDITLFHEHFGKYVAYVFWYGALISALWWVYIFATIFFSALHWNLGLLFFIWWGLYIIYITTRITFSWYHMLSEGSGSLAVFLDGGKYTIGKISETFFKVLGFTLLVWFVSLIIEFFMVGFLDEPLMSGTLTHIGTLMEWGAQNIVPRMKELIIVLESKYGEVSFAWFFLSFVYSLSSVISRGLFHIFFVRYYMDVREETQKSDIE